MGKELAICVLHENLKDNDRQELLDQRKSEIDDDFYAHLEDVSNKYVQQEEPDAALRVLRVFYMAGDATGSAYHQATAFFNAAMVQLYRKANTPESQSKEIKESIRKLKSCMNHCLSSNDRRCYEIAASAYEMLGLIHFRELFDPDSAHDYFNNAKSLFESLHRHHAVERIQGHLADLSNAAMRTDMKPLTRILNDIRHADELLRRLSAETTEKQENLTKLDDRARLLGPTVKGLKDQYKELRSENKKLKARVQILTNAVQVPLWVAVIRSELDSGTLSQLTLKLLERMRLTEPDHAESLLTEIRARSDLPTDAIIDLSGLSGEQRLFAGIANSRALESTDWEQSVEVLVDAWESYLRDMIGGDRSSSKT